MAPTPSGTSTPVVHRYQASGGGVPVNAYLVEGERGVVGVDATLTVSDGRALRAAADGLGKPLEGVVVTHPHPDHYGGLVELVRGLDVPVWATAGVIEVARRDDAAKEAILRPMFGDEWPAERAFPAEVVAGGAELSVGDIELTVLDLGPGESPHDTVWQLGTDRATVFSADLAYNHMHGYLADGYWEQWLASIERLAGALAPGATLHPGHGDPATAELLGWQRGYIECFVDAVRGADWRAPERARESVLAAIGDYLPRDELRFLVELSIEPVAAQLGLLDASGDAG